MVEQDGSPSDSKMVFVLLYVSTLRSTMVASCRHLATIWQRSGSVLVATRCHLVVNNIYIWMTTVASHSLTANRHFGMSLDVL